MQRGIDRVLAMQVRIAQHESEHSMTVTALRTVTAPPESSRDRSEVDCAHVVLIGAFGFIGKVHARIYRALGMSVTPIDPIAGTESHRGLDRINWSDTIVDICTPTATHTSCLAQMYALGARHFVVEKPAATDAASWRAQVAAMPGARIFVVHNYLFSRAFRICRDMISEPVEISTTFSKNRTADDARGRGEGPDGRLAHVLHVEAPHLFAMTLALAPNLQMLTSDQFVLGGRRPSERGAPVAASATLRNSAGLHAILRTHLRKPIHRVFRVTEWDGRTVEVRFPTTSAQRATVIERHVDGRTTTVFDGTDDLMTATLQSAVTSLRQGEIPWEASASFAESVLECIDNAMLTDHADTVPRFASHVPVLHR
jgi:predicted dehydrogenase